MIKTPLQWGVFFMAKIVDIISYFKLSKYNVYTITCSAG